VGEKCEGEMKKGKIRKKGKILIFLGRKSFFGRCAVAGVEKRKRGGGGNFSLPI